MSGEETLRDRKSCIVRRGNICACVHVQPQTGSWKNPEGIDWIRNKLRAGLPEMMRRYGNWVMRWVV